MFKIILIKPNEFDINCIPYKSNPNKIFKEINRDDFFEIKSNYVDFDKFKDIIKDYIEVIEVDETTFMKEIVNKISLDDKHYGDVRDCYDDPNNLYQIMFKLISQYDNRNTLKNNLLASLITYQKELIYGNVVLFKTNLPKDNYEMSNIDVYIDDIIKLVMNNIYHTGVYVEENKIDQIFYNNKFEFVDPKNQFCKRNDIDHILKDEKFGFQSKSLLKYNMQFVFDKDSYESINDPITRLMSAPIRGKGVITSPYENNNSFFDLSIEEVINLLKVSPNFELKSNDTNEEKDILERKIIKNKYRILNSRLK